MSFLAPAGLFLLALAVPIMPIIKGLLGMAAAATVGCGAFRTLRPSPRRRFLKERMRPALPKSETKQLSE